MSAAGPIDIARIHDDPAGTRGARVLVDRLWPRGISREAARLDAWIPQAAPSDALRKRFGHDPARWPEFRERYRAELARSPEATERLLELCRQGPVTLLFAARDRERNNAAALRDLLVERLAAEDDGA